jgi:polysaccharide pyruvyl transferase WcaK-like protein
MTDFTLWLLSTGYRVKIFTSDPSVDVYAIDDLKERLERRLPRASVDAMFGIASNQVSTLLEEMRTFDFVVTPKFHGVVFSHLLSKPVLAISYHNKIDDLMRAAGDSAYCLDIERFDSEGLQASFLMLAENAPALRTKLRELTQARAGVLTRQFDGLFVSEYLQGASRRVARRGLAEARS